jgi:hypothetical protein
VTVGARGSERRDRELDAIVDREKPGFQRVPARRQSATARKPVADAGTPDIAALQAKAHSLTRGVSGATPVGRGSEPVTHGATPPSGAAKPAGRGSRSQPSHHILTVRHARSDESDPLPSRVIVVSRRNGRIVGEQG